MTRGIHLVGSVPGTDSADVFRRVSAALGPRLKRIPDGETGERADWITWLEPVFAASPALEKSDEVFRLHPTAPPRIRYRLKAGHTANDVAFDNLFYADIAERSYRDFARLKAEGVEVVRFRDGWCRGRGSLVGGGLLALIGGAHAVSS